MARKPLRKHRPSSNVEPIFTDEDMLYSDDEWVVPAQDAKGHSVREFLRIQPGLERDIEIMMQCGKFPYETRTDLVRHALVRHVAWLHRLEPNMPRHFLASTMAMNKLMSDDQHRTDTEATFRRLQDLIEQHLQRGDGTEAIKTIAFTKAKLQDVADCAWRRRFMDRFNRQYSGYLAPQVYIMPALAAPEPATDAGARDEDATVERGTEQETDDE
jgi:hypothetical protein